MKINTSDLIGKPLDWAVAKSLNKFPINLVDEECFYYFSPSTNWDQCNEIIERENLVLVPPNTKHGMWMASILVPSAERSTGPTPLIAAMRCIVASKIGDEVEIPEELV